MGLFNSVPLAFSLPVEWSLGATGMAATLLPFLRAYPAHVTEHSQGPFLFGSCHTLGKEEELQGRMLA